VTAPPQLTPEQVEHVTRQLRAVTEAYRSMLATLAPAVAETCRQLHDALKSAGLLDKDGKPTTRPDRPAWQTPYGPPQKGHRP
jgi:hypothetical protein